MLEHASTQLYSTLGYDSAGSLNWKPNESQLKFLRAKGFTCSSCGLKSRGHKLVPSGFMDIQKIHGEHKCLCAICSASRSFHKQINGSYSHGKLIYCTDFNQTQMNQLIQRFLLAIYRDEQISIEAEMQLETLIKEHSQQLSPIFGQPSIELQKASEYILNLGPKSNEDLSVILKGLIYIPNQSSFEDVIEFWNVAAFGHLNEDSLQHLEDEYEESDEGFIDEFAIEEDEFGDIP